MNAKETFTSRFLLHLQQKGVMRPVAVRQAVALLLDMALVLQPRMLRAQTTNALTLNDCLRESLSANHVLLGRSAESDAARARPKGSTAARLPRLFLQGSAQHASDPYRLQPATADGQPGIFTRDIWQAGAGLGVPLYAGGRLAAEQDTARLLAGAGAASSRRGSLPRPLVKRA